MKSRHTNTKLGLFRYVGRLVTRVMAIGMIVLLLFSCGEKPVFNSEFDVAGNWNYSDSVTFELPVPDTNFAYDLVLDIRHKQDYPFQNIYFKIATVFPSGRYSVDLLNINLADKGGSWYGDCSGDQCELSAPLRTAFAFSEIGTYQISISQHTRSDQLSGIESIELQLWPAAPLEQSLD